MQYLEITKDLTLSDLARIVGERNVDSVLNANGLDRSVNVGEEFFSREVPETDVDYQQKLNVLNRFVGDYDLFERAALGSDDSWRTLSQYNSFPDAIRIPSDVHLPDSEGVLGNGEPIPSRVYQACVNSIKFSEDHSIDPAIFADYNASFSGSNYGITSTGNASDAPVFENFRFPKGEVGLYSSLSDEIIYFPVYPDGFEDGYSANYEEMPEMLYQYEPWKVYKSSGPREITFNFKFHRDMWTGDHRDGKANELIRACQANCFPEYDGSLVNVSTVTLYIHGRNLITGVMTSCKPSWDKPIGLDGFYLMCELSISITEVSPEALNYSSVKSKELIS